MQNGNSLPMGFKEEARNNFTKFFIVIACLLISGILANITYILFAIGLTALIPGGSGVKEIIFVFAVGLTIFTWVTCFKWLYACFFKRNGKGGNNNGKG